MSSKPDLTIEALKTAAAEFSTLESDHNEPSLYGVDNGKTIGTYVEHKFRLFLLDRFNFTTGNSAKGIDFPLLNVDMKTTSIRQPQSSCPFKSARQKIYGLNGYHLLIMVYEKTDEPAESTAKLDIQSTIFIENAQTARLSDDFRPPDESSKTKANHDDLVAFMSDKNLPVDDIEANRLAERTTRPAPRTRLPHHLKCLAVAAAIDSRAIAKAGTVDGVLRRWVDP